MSDKKVPAWELSSMCRCGPTGKATCKMGECPHLYHVCTPACGKFYKNSQTTKFVAQRKE